MNLIETKPVGDANFYKFSVDFTGDDFILGGKTLPLGIITHDILNIPADKLLYAELYQTGDRKKCTECGAFFASSSNSVKYCPDCRKRITRRQAAERMRKRRAPVTQ